MSEELSKRRKLVCTKDNPDSSHDYLCELRRQISINRHKDNEHRVELVLRYVPDKLVLDTFEMEPYFEFISELDWHSLELIALDILEDINNEVIPRWVQVSSAFRARREDAISSEVTVEDHQPDWENTYLMNRINMLERPIKR